MAKKRKQVKEEPVKDWNAVRPDFRWWFLKDLGQYESIGRDQLSRLAWFLIMETVSHHQRHIVNAKRVLDSGRRKQIERFNARCIITVCEVARHLKSTQLLNTEPDLFPLLSEIEKSAYEMGGPLEHPDL